MLSVPTLWLVFAVNFLALAPVWTYVMRCYPNFEAARFWTAAAFAAAAGALASLMRDSLAIMLPLLIGGTLLILACCLARWEGSSIRIAASIGVAQWSPFVGVHPERLIAVADDALYSAKKQGRNRCVVHEPAPPLALELEEEAADLASLSKMR
jgi:Diguanylate cyclase, GGDEF domain